MPNASSLIDDIRDEADTELQICLALRQTCRSLPILFQSKNDTVRQAGVRQCLTAFVFHTPERSIEKFKLAFAPYSGPGEADAVSDSMRAVNFIARAAIAKSGHEFKSFIELSLADSFDASRPIKENYPKDAKIIRLSRSEIRETTADQITWDLCGALEYDVGFVWTEPLINAHLSYESVQPYYFNVMSGVFSNNPLLWAFWADWYQGFLDGKPLDWELQRRVALIPDEDWDQGPAHIADRIEEIKAAFLAEKVPLAETVALNPATNLFHVVPIPVQNAPLVGALLSRVVDALDDAVQGNNGLRPDSREVRVLTRAAQRYGNDPQRLEMDFTSVAVGLRRQIHDSHELPDSEDNLALLEAVEEGARGLRAEHPEVAANRATLAAQALRELSPEQKAELAEALPVLQAISEGMMADDFATDIPALINDALLPLPTGAPRLPGLDASARVFSRVAKISVWAKTSGYIHQVDGHAVYKAARITTTLAGLVTIGLAIYGVL